MSGSGGFNFNDIEQEDPNLFSTNFKLTLIFLLAFFCILLARIWYLQILQGDEFRRFSEKNLFKESDVYAPRGIIYDRDGRILVENLPAYRATVTPQYVFDLPALAKDLGKALELSSEDIIKKVKRSRRQNGPFHQVAIKQHLSRDELFKVELLKIDHSGLDAQEFILRNYPNGKVGAHLLGYVGEISKKQIPILTKRRNIRFKPKDIIGKNGLEEKFDDLLRGDNGKAYIIVDAKGRSPAESQLNKSIGELLKDLPATPGADMYTTIDSDIQKAAYESFEKHKRVGSLIAISPKGEILAWISHPAFDPNQFSKGVDTKTWRKWLNSPDRPLGNKVIQDHYSPGSTFKPIVALAALQEKKIREGKFIFSPYRLKLGRKHYHNYSQSQHGYVNVVQAIERSFNTFFYKLGHELGIDPIAKYAAALGMGQKTGVPLRREISGLIPTSEWKKKRYGVPWQPGETYSVSIGQGYVLTTAIQLATAYSGIALEGKVFRPQIVKKIASDEKGIFQSFEPVLAKDLTDPEAEGHIMAKHFKTVKKGLYSVVNGRRGSARLAKLKGLHKIAGKTGTVQVRSFSAEEIYKSCDNRPRKYRHHGWFVGYAPSAAPEITVAVLTEHSCSSSASVPIAKDVILAYLKKYKNYQVESSKDEQRQPQS